MVEIADATLGRHDWRHIRNSLHTSHLLSEGLSQIIVIAEWARVTLVPINTTALISAIDSEIAALQQARALFAGKDAPFPFRAAHGKKKRHISAEARERIAAAQRARRAKQKRAAKKTA